MAAGSLNGAEIAQVQRIAHVCPPRADLGVVAAGIWEQAAENAKANTI